MTVNNTGEPGEGPSLPETAPNIDPPRLMPCFFCGDLDEGDGFRHYGVPICVICDDVHTFTRNGGQMCCEPQSEDHVELKLD